jgi:hypothetical protein
MEPEQLVHRAECRDVLVDRPRSPQAASWCHALPSLEGQLRGLKEDTYALVDVVRCDRQEGLLRAGLGSAPVELDEQVDVASKVESFGGADGVGDCLEVMVPGSGCEVRPTALCHWLLCPGSQDRHMFGGEEEDRTPDLRIANATLSQLSYPPTTRRSIDDGLVPEPWPGLRRGRCGGPAQATVRHGRRRRSRARLHWCRAARTSW